MTMISSSAIIDRNKNKRKKKLAWHLNTRFILFQAFVIYIVIIYSFYGILLNMDIAFLECKILRIIKNILKTLLKHSILIIIIAYFWSNI